MTPSLPCSGATALLFPEYPHPKNPDDMIPDQAAPAPAFCNPCPNRLPCLVQGWDEEYGAWGGLNPTQRLEAKARRLDPGQALQESVRP